jgi:uncharacterized membrane protein YbhN (UPF0104 family)
LEAIKWKYLARKIESLSFLRAFRGILTGVTLSMATPLGLGDYAGRILQLNAPDRVKGIGAVFTSRILQLYITLICGSISVFYLFLLDADADWKMWLALLLVIILNIFFILLLIFHKQILLKIKEVKIFKKLYPYFEIINQYEFKELTFALWISFFRYVVFAFQFIIILYLTGVSHNIGILFLGVNFIFLMKSLIPTLFELGVREMAAIFFFGTLASLEHPPGGGDYKIMHDKLYDSIIFSSLSVWIINILIPSAIGLFLVFKLKFYTKE